MQRKIRLQPALITFTQLQFDFNYSSQFKIINVSDKSIRFKIIRNNPHSGLSVDTKTISPLAAGMSQLCSVLLQNFPQQDFSEQIQIRCEQGQTQILRVQVNSLRQLQYKRELKLSSRLGWEQTGVLELQNRRNRPSDITLKSVCEDGLSLYIKQKQFRLGGFQTTKVQLLFVLQKERIGKCCISILCNDKQLDLVRIEVHPLIDQRLLLLHNLFIKSHRISTAYYLQNIELPLTLVNNSNSNYNFQAKLKRINTSIPRNPVQMAIQFKQNNLSTKPTHGIVMQFSSVPLTLSLQKRPSDLQHDVFKINHSKHPPQRCEYEFSVNFQDGLKISLPIQVFYEYPCLQLSSQVIELQNNEGSCLITNPKDRQIKVLTRQGQFVQVYPAKLRLSPKTSRQLFFKVKSPSKKFISQILAIYVNSLEFQVQVKVIQDNYSLSRLTPSRSEIQVKSVAQKRNSSSLQLKPISGLRQRNASASILAQRSISTKILGGKASSLKQANEITEELNFQELQKIIILKVKLDFGQAYVGSDSTQSLHVRNGSTKSISIQLLVDSPIFHKSFQKLQILPAGRSACIQVVWSPKVEGRFSQTLKYLINNKHEFVFKVQGRALLINIGLSRHSIDFDFQQSKKIAAEQQFFITNQSSQRTKYTWLCQNQGPFSINKLTGQIQPLEKLHFVITYFPLFQNSDLIQKSHKAKFTLLVQFGKEQHLECVGSVTQGRLVFKTSELIIQQAYVNEEVSLSLQVKNISKFQTAFKLYFQQLSRFIGVQTLQDQILPQATRDVSFRFLSSNPLDLRNTISCKIRAGKQILIPYRIRVVQPIVTLHPELIDLGKVEVVGEPVQHQLTVVNQAKIGLQLKITKLDMLQSSQQLYFTVVGDKQQNRKLFSQDSIRLGSRKSLKIKLFFTPARTIAYKFQIPLFLNKPFRNLVTCQGINSFVTLSSSVLQFNKILLNLDESLSSLKAQNNSAQQIHWKLISDNIIPFYCLNSEGQISSFSEAEILFHYGSKQEGKHFIEAKLQFSIQTQSIIRTIKLNGQSKYPVLQFSVAQVVFPHAPVKQQIQVQFVVLNQGYNNMKLSYQIPPNPVQLVLQFPDGVIMGMGKDRLKIRARAVSKEVCSFSYNVVFKDQNNTRFPLKFSGTFDNSILTVAPFFIQKQIPRQITKIFLQSHIMSKKQFYKREALHLTQFMSRKLKFQIKEFPQTFTKGLTAVSPLIAYFFPKLLSKLDQAARKYSDILEQFNWLLRTLRAEGCCIGSIIAMHLISFQEYEKKKGNSKKRMWWLADQQFAQACTQSWVQLIYQMLKVYSKNNFSIQLKRDSRLSYIAYDDMEQGFVTWINQNKVESKTDIINTYFEVLTKVLHQASRTLQIQTRQGRAVKGFISILQLLNGVSLLSQFQLQRCSGRMLLLQGLAILFMSQSMRPKEQTIKIECKLKEEIKHSLTIQNYLREQLQYSVLLTGKDFYLETSALSVPAKSQRVLKLYFNAKVCGRHNCYLLLVQPKLFLKNTVIVIKVQIQVNFGQPDKIIKIKGKLYESQQIQVEVESNLPADGQFMISQFKGTISTIRKTKRISTMIKPTTKKKNIQILNDKVVIKKGQKGKIKVMYSPQRFQPESRSFCFVDLLVGQFVLQIKAFPDFPNPKLELKPTQAYYVGTSYQFLIPFNSGNQSGQKKMVTTKQILYESMFDVKVQSSRSRAVSFSSQFNLKDIKSVSNINFAVSFKFDQAQKQALYKFIFIGKKKTDVRIFTVSLVVLPKPEKLTIRMVSQIGKQTSQSFPISNFQSRDVNYSVQQQLVSDEIQLSWRKTVINSNSKSNIEIVFRPKAIETYRQKLRIKGERFCKQYIVQVQGIGVFPKAIEKINFKCQAGSQVQLPIALKNSLIRHGNYTVSIDNPVITGPSSFRLEYQPVYRARVKAVRIGTYQASLSFQEDQHKFFWVSVSIDTRQTRARQEIKLHQQEREQKKLMLQIQNRFDLQLQFKVILNSIFFRGNRYHLAPPGKSYYQLTYLPFSSFHDNVFFSCQLDQFFFSIDCQCSPKVKKLPLMKAQLGKQSHTFLQVSNPFAFPITATLSSSNPKVFYSNQNDFILGALSMSRVFLVFNPTVIGRELSDLQLKTEKMGSWFFKVIGEGVNPLFERQLSVESELYKQTLYEINFKNPFSYEIIVSIQIPQSKQFAFLIDSRRPLIKSNQHLRIPLTFKPTCNRIHGITVKISLNQDINWIYKIQGKVFCINKTNRHLAFQCGESFYQFIKFQLAADPGPSVRLDLELITQSQLLRKAMSSNKQLGINRSLQLKICVFKPIHQVVRVLISSEEGGVWIFFLQFKIVNNKIVQQFTVESKLNNLSVFNFYMNNRLRRQSSFTAYITNESDTVFLISPKEGVLPGYGKQGLKMRVSFLPTQYKRMFKGELIVQTQQTQWRYLLKGVFAKYIPP